MVYCTQITVQKPELIFFSGCFEYIEALGGENEAIKEFESGRNAIFAIFDFFSVGKK